MRLARGGFVGLAAVVVAGLVAAGGASGQVRDRRQVPGRETYSNPDVLPAQKPSPSPTGPRPAMQHPDGGDDVGCASIVSGAGRLDPARKVTLDYIRMHEPDLIAAMGEAVRQGKMRAGDLADLGSPELVRQVVGADWSRVLSAPRQATEGPGLTAMRPPLREAPACAEAGVTDPAAARNGPRDSLRWHQPLDSGAGPSRESGLSGAAAQAASALLNQMTAVDITPGRVDLGSVMVGERKRAGFRVISMAGGALAVRVPQAPHCGW